jgi:hypothetical protein
MSFDIKAVREKAEKEIQDERMEKAKKKLVTKLRELDAAKMVVRNIKHELKVLEADISEEF